MAASARGVACSVALGTSAGAGAAGGSVGSAEPASEGRNSSQREQSANPLSFASPHLSQIHWSVRDLPHVEQSVQPGSVAAPQFGQTAEDVSMRTPFGSAATPDRLNPCPLAAATSLECDGVCQPTNLSSTFGPAQSGGRVV